MEHFPGTLLIKKAQIALKEGKEVVFYVQGIADPVSVDSAETDGPLAVLSTSSGERLIRLDALVGINVATPYNVGAIVG